MLDTRQYRHDQIYCSGVTSELVDQYDSCYGKRFDEPPTRSITGDAQETWLKGALTSSGPQWNVLAKQIPMFAYDSYYVDAWDGYAGSRHRVLKHLATSGARNPIVITGDMHCAWVSELKYHPDYPDDPSKDPSKLEGSKTIGTEFTGTSISTSLSDGWKTTYTGARPSNPHVKYLDTRQGSYVLCTVTPQEWRSDFRLAASLRDPKSAVSTIASWRVDDGNPVPIQIDPV